MPLDHIESNFQILRTAMLAVAAEDTSYDPDVWRSRREKSPLTGHCGAASYVVQALFGGEILSGSVDGERHLWNRIPGFRDIDLTSCQFGGDGLTPVAAGRVKLPTTSVNPRFRRFFSRVKKNLIESGFSSFCGDGGVIEGIVHE